MCQQVSLLYDADTGTVHKHGPTHAVQKYLQSETGQRLMTLFPIRQITFEASADAAEWINSVLSCSGSLLIKLKALQEIAKPI